MNLHSLILKRTWDKVAETYNMDVSVGEIELSKEILEILKSLKISKKSKFIEAGSGSGHLSGLIAKKGYDTTLLDISDKALAKSKKFFSNQKITGTFIEADLLNLSKQKIPTYDVVWNSGVMEHFNNHELYEIFSGLKRIARKYLLIIVPNPESVPYLLFRFKLMRNKLWSFGTEYLRNDYEKYANHAGFELVKKEYLGWTFVNYFIDNVFGSTAESGYFKEMVKAGLLPSDQAYLVLYLFKKQGFKVKEIRNRKPKEEIFTNPETLTQRFDRLATLKKIVS